MPLRRRLEGFTIRCWVEDVKHSRPTIFWGEGMRKEDKEKKENTGSMLRELYRHREKFKDEEELKERIEMFLEICFAGSLPITYTGAMLVLGLRDKQELSYLRHDPKYGTIIKELVGMIENYYETRLSGNNAVGAIFALKNMGWSDATAVTLNDVSPERVKQVSAQLAVLEALRKNNTMDTHSKDIEG